MSDYKRRSTWFFLLLVLAAPAKAQSPPDSLTLYNPTGIEAVVRRSGGGFVIYMKFNDIPDSIGTYVHPPDTTGWRWSSPDSVTLSDISLSGYYTGDVDRRISFRALNGGVVGQDTSIPLFYEIIGEEQWRNTVDLGISYNPGETIPLLFVNKLTGDTLDLGIGLSFSPGVVDSNGVFKVYCEDFEGFHIWRGIDPDSMIAIGEISKEEAFDSMLCDSIYFDGMLPDLRSKGVYFFKPGYTCFEKQTETKIELPLESDQLFWVDFNAFNGFTYYYAVTTYDRGYLVKSGRQGLVKTDSPLYCRDQSGRDVLCPGSFVKVSVNVSPQDNLALIYAVPNPYRSGGSVYTTPNYHNFPDNKIRFVNVPANCRLAIYTTAGDLVWETRHNNPAVGNVEWDVRNQSGMDVASGIYVYKVQDDKGRSMYGRLVIIR